LAFTSRQASTNDLLTLLDMATQRETRFETSWQATQWIGFTPDDRQLLIISTRPKGHRTNELTSNLTAWGVDTGHQLWQRAIIEAVRWGGCSAQWAISPDGTAFAFAIPDGRVQVLETKDGSERFTIKTSEEHVLVVAFSPDSSTLLTGGGYNEPAIRCWEALNGRAGGSLAGHTSGVTDLLFTPDGTQLISSSTDQTIRLWDWSSRHPAGVLRGHLSEVAGLALASDGRSLASRSKDGFIYLWDLSKPSHHLGYRTLPNRLARGRVFTPDSRSILGVEPGGGVAFWDAPTLRETRRLWGDSTNKNDIILSPDARWVIWGGPAGHLHVWDVRSGMESTNFIVAPGELLAERFTDNGKFLVTLYGPDSNVFLETWAADTWQRKSSVTLHFNNIGPVFTTSLPNSLVIQADGAFHFFDVTKPNDAPRLIKSPGDLSGGVATSPDGRMAAVTEASVELWDMATLQPVDVLTGFLLNAFGLAFSPDGRRLAVGSGGPEAVKLWDTETRQEVLTLSGEEMFFGCKFSPDGRYLMGVNTTGLVHLWFAPTLAEIDAAEKAEAATGN
jgi:WD40 repeat protein